ncbi:MAG: tetratricopeptide repeat protein [Burkholderiales bacterium]
MNKPFAGFATAGRSFGRGLTPNLLGLLIAVFAVLPAHADDIAGVNKLVRAGQYPEALSMANDFLAKHPRDAEMRFMKGVILTEQKKSDEAIVIFTKLTQDFPELPEPYNNLAVLYAASGQYDKARQALDAAIRTNPAYATAYENLGDIHAKLASQAYDKALQLDSGNAAAKSKLTMLRTLTGNTALNAKPVAVAKPAAVTVAAAAPSPSVSPVPVQKSAVAPEPEKPAKPAKQAPKAVAASDDNEEILSTVHHWAKAWSEQDVKSYLNFYSNDFETPKGESHKAWAEERHQRIEGKGHIEVRIEAPQVRVSGNTATVKFRQIYVSDRLKADSRKVLSLIRDGGKWQIKQERTGS